MRFAPTARSQRRSNALGAMHLGGEVATRLLSLASTNFPRLTQVCRRASETAGSGMFRRSSSSLRLLVAVLFGLNALCLTSVAHGLEKVRQASLSFRAPAASRSDFSQNIQTGWVPTLDLNPVVAGTRPYVSDAAAGHLRHAPCSQMARLLRHASDPGSLFREVRVDIANIAETLPARASVLPLGDFPRAPGPSRAPPAA
jgi:hypothetical protein